MKGEDLHAVADWSLLDPLVTNAETSSTRQRKRHKPWLSFLPLWRKNYPAQQPRLLLGFLPSTLVWYTRPSWLSHCCSFPTGVLWRGDFKVLSLLTQCDQDYPMGPPPSQAKPLEVISWVLVSKFLSSDCGPSAQGTPYSWPSPQETACSFCQEHGLCSLCSWRPAFMNWPGVTYDFSAWFLRVQKSHFTIQFGGSIQTTTILIICTASRSSVIDLPGSFVIWPPRLWPKESYGQAEPWLFYEHLLSLQGLCYN